MWKKVYDKLIENNLNPFQPGKHKGLCTESYCVVIEGTQLPHLQTNQLGQKRIDMILFIPVASYIQIEPYAESIRSALKGLNGLRKTGFESQVLVDDDKKAFTMSIEYVIQKKLEG